MGMAHHLDDRYTALKGRVFMSGTQALVRLPMAQMRRDHQRRLNTATFITGYRGSPLGAFDQQLARAADHLQPLGVHFQPGVNEDLAATAIWGTQQVPLSGQATHDGVLGIWYGKGPGVDRCGDVFKHGNAAGSSTHGGVLCIAGDDHAAKSSTLPHQSDHAFMAAVMPVLYPSSIHEFIDLGLLGVAMSRYSGCWTGFKVIADTVETSAVVELGDEQRDFVLPDDFEWPQGGLNLRWPDPPLVQDERLQEHKAYAALAFARANGIDQVVLDSPGARLGIVASGKAYEDVRQALVELGLDQAAIDTIGLRVYKVRMPWPLEPQGVRHFSEGLEEVLVVEERREIIENQIKQQLFNWRADVRPRIIGKFDEKDAPFLPLSTALSISRVARAIAGRVLRLPVDDGLRHTIEQRLAYLQRRADERVRHVAPIERQPWFCAGCPHNTSTNVPEGSTAMAGIGCHYMVTWMNRNTNTFTQMGGEGVPWVGIAPFTGENHRFANLGDGTYFHSGLLAIRASIAAGVNITYKILYNDAVAMTGGQSVDGDLSPADVTKQLYAEGVGRIVLVSDEPEVHRPAELAPQVRIDHRDRLDAVQRELREVPGCTAIVYVQTCAAEKRRRRKRGTLNDPDLRLYIHPAVCEGCGDCSVQSNCVAVEPLETAMGRKRRINQSACNKDYSCLKGFCPSFVSIEGSQPKGKPDPVARPVIELPDPAVPVLGDRPCNILITGVGGTGVLTIGSLLGMAAHIDGHASLVLDMAGLAQKGGAVTSLVRLADQPGDVTSPHIVAGGTDVLLAADEVVAAGSSAVVLCDPARTSAVVNTRTAPVAGFIVQRDLDFCAPAVSGVIARQVRGQEHFHSFAELAEQLLGDAIATNVMMVGYTWQQGLLPLSLAALQQAIELNGVAVQGNLQAFELGRQLAVDPQQVKRLASTPGTAEPVVLSLPELFEHRSGHLRQYQGPALVKRYTALVAQAREQLETRLADESTRDGLLRAVALNHARLLAYKDEYEVARLFSVSSFRNELNRRFAGDLRLTLHLAPPFMGSRAPDGRPRKRRFGPWILSLFRLLQHGRVLRGTPLDPFGYSRERRAERALIERYEADVKEVLAGVTPERTDLALAILQLPDRIRGYGPVKQTAMQQAEVRRQALLAEWHQRPVAAREQPAQAA